MKEREEEEKKVFVNDYYIKMSPTHQWVYRVLYYQVGAIPEFRFLSHGYIADFKSKVESIGRLIYFLKIYNKIN